MTWFVPVARYTAALKKAGGVSPGCTSIDHNQNVDLPGRCSGFKATYPQSNARIRCAKALAAASPARPADFC